MAETDGACEAFADKVCVVTGAGSGIGRALALALALRGARLAISDLDPESVAQTAMLAALSAAEVEHYRLDVSDREAVFAHAAAVRARFGPANVVINNAGVALVAEAAEMRIEDFRWLMDVDFWGVVHGSQAFLPQLIESGDGRLVNVSSVAGLIGVARQSAYTAAKFAVRGFTEALARELLVSGAPVSVSCVHPGGVRTNIARSARTYTGETAEQRAQAFAKIAHIDPDKAAQAILEGVERGAPKILVGLDARLTDLLARALGASFQRVVSKLRS